MLIQAAVGLRGRKASARPGFPLAGGGIAKAKRPGRLSALAKRSRSSARIKNQPGEMFPIAINNIAGLAVARISRFMGCFPRVE
jgi:hypothetical protein